MAILLPILFTLLTAITTGSGKPWLILGAVVSLTVVATTIAWKVSSHAHRQALRTRFVGIQDHRAFPGVMAIAIVILVVANGYAIMRKSRTSPVVLVVPDDRFIKGLSDAVRLELYLQEPDGQTRGPWSISSYEGRPIWIGTREELAVSAQTRNNYLCFRLFHEPELFPRPPVELRPGTRIMIKFYYANSRKPYREPPHEPIVVSGGRKDPDAIQVEVLEGPL